MEKLCKNCKYYTPYKDELDEGFGSCDCPKFKYDISYSAKKRIETDNLLYRDAEEYSASFDVGEAFGCIHFKEED